VDQRELVVLEEALLALGVLAVDGHPHRHALEQVRQRRQLSQRLHSIRHRRPLGQLELDLIAARTLAQDRE
jgi:hypothetical protein